MSVYKSKEKMKITFFKMGTSPKSSEFTCLHYITVYYITLQYITLHYSKVQHITLHTTVHCIILQYITVNYITYMHRTWCTKTYVTKGAQVLCHVIMVLRVVHAALKKIKHSF